jgi:hypothetical protein
MRRIRLLHLVTLLCVVIQAACQPLVRLSDVAMLGMGDRIDGMLLTDGAADATPLGAFCSFTGSTNLVTANCRVPRVSRLAIGQALLTTGEFFPGIAWSDLAWELSIDGQPVDLHAFGTYEYVLPAIARTPSLVREVFTKQTAWDIVLSELQPGSHIVDGLVHHRSAEYTWVVNLVIVEE